MMRMIKVELNDILLLMIGFLFKQNVLYHASVMIGINWASKRVAFILFILMETQQSNKWYSLNTHVVLHFHF